MTFGELPRLTLGEWPQNETPSNHAYREESANDCSKEQVQGNGRNYVTRTSPNQKQ